MNTILFAHSLRVGAIATVMTGATLLLGACGGGGGGSGGDNGGGCGGAYGSPCPPPNAGAPTVTLGALSASLNRSVTLTATPTAPNGVLRVDFLVDGNVVGMATASPYTAVLNTGTLTDGAHAVTARVTDTQSQIANSAAANVTVANNITINVAMSPGEEFPVPASTATGAGTLAVNLSTGVISGNLVVTGMTANMAHIHDAYAGNNGLVQIGFAPHATIANRWDLPAGSTLTAAQVTRLLEGALYLNAHSVAFGNGEVRGQIKPANIRVVYADMSGAQEVPAVVIAASGRAAVTVDNLTSQASVHLNSTGVDDADMGHIHIGAAGANGVVIIPLVKDTAVGRAGHWSAEKQTVTSANLTLFGNSGWYANIHTPTFATGAIRGQITLPAAATTLTQIQSTIFGPICAGCHAGGGATLPASMNLSNAGASFAALVDVNSVEQPAVKRVLANDPANSYLIRKLEGTAGITGSRMPLGGPFLDQPTIDTVKSWINAGALNN